MHCPWCHNPETLSGKEELLFYRDKCVGCGACTAVSAACTLENGKMCLDRAHPEMTPEIAKVCFSGALERCGKDVTAEQVMEEVLQDEDYYLESGGGVTLSGGEVLLQADFALKLLYLCKEHNISTAIESCMNTSSEILQKSFTKVTPSTSIPPSLTESSHWAARTVSSMRSSLTPKHGARVRTILLLIIQRRCVRTT